MPKQHVRELSLLLITNNIYSCITPQKRNLVAKRADDQNAIIVSDLQSNAVSTLQSSKKSSHQMTIQTGMECTCQSDIFHTNNAILEMVIADFFLCKYIPDSVVEST